jgi:hypothetical protein
MIESVSKRARMPDGKQEEGPTPSPTPGPIQIA